MDLGHQTWPGLWAPVMLHLESEIAQPNRETETWQKKQRVIEKYK